jgi:hypothetical protein
MTPERDWLDYASFFLDVVALVVTLGGLGFVVAALRQTGRQQRIEAAPYVRIDIGLKDGIPDRPGVADYYEDTSQKVNLTLPEQPSLEVCAWFRNYQSSDLGFAMGVIATFLVELSDATETSIDFVDVEIPYLEFEKTVKVDLAAVPATKEMLVMVTSLVFYDFYDQYHKHTYGRKSSNGLHGRLVFISNSEVTESSPEGRSRGKGVDYNVGAIN